MIFQRKREKYTRLLLNKKLSMKQALVIVCNILRRFLLEVLLSEVRLF